MPHFMGNWRTQICRTPPLDRHQAVDYSNTSILMLWRFYVNRTVDMNRPDRELERVLGGYAEFLRRRRLAAPRHQPHLVRWGRDFLSFAAEHRGYTFEQTLDLFLTAIGKWADIRP